MKVSKGLGKILTGDNLKEFLDISKTKYVLDKIGFKKYDEVILLSDIHNALSETANILTSEECKNLMLIVEHIREQQGLYKKEVSKLVVKINGDLYAKTILEGIVNSFHKNLGMVDVEISEKRLKEMEISLRRSCLYFLSNNEVSHKQEIKEYQETTFSYDGEDKKAMLKATRESLKQALNVLNKNRGLSIFYPELYTNSGLSMLEDCLTERFINEHKAIVQQTGINNKEDRLDALADIFGIGENFHSLSHEMKECLKRIINETDLNSKTTISFVEYDKNEYHLKLPEHRVIQVAYDLEKNALQRFFLNLTKAVEKINLDEVNTHVECATKINEVSLYVKLSDNLTKEESSSIIDAYDQIFKSIIQGKNAKIFNQIYVENSYKRHIKEITEISPILEIKIASLMNDIALAKGCSQVKINILKKECCDVLGKLYEQQEKSNNLNQTMK